MQPPRHTVIMTPKKKFADLVFFSLKKNMYAYTYMQGRRNHILTYWTGRVEQNITKNVPHPVEPIRIGLFHPDPR